MNRSSTFRIMPMGLLIFSAALSMKYGMSPWMRLSDANVSDALSDARKLWNIVEASLQCGKFARGR